MSASRSGTKKDGKTAFVVTSGLVKFAAYGVTYEARPDHPQFGEMQEWLKAGQTRKAVGAYNKGLKKVAVAGFSVSDDTLYYKGQKMPKIFSEVYSSVLSQPHRLKALELFFDNLVKNPSPMSVEAFARFLQNAKAPITDRGTFLVYKKVTHDWKDCHTKTFDNHPGVTVEMPRERVDPNQNNECSTGFHCCSYNYIGSFGGDRIVVVEVNPADVVAVPPDYKGSKMRVCKYTVMSTLPDLKAHVAEHMPDILGSMPFFRASQEMGKFKHSYGLRGQ
jgi:hypothetical protein